MKRAHYEDRLPCAVTEKPVYIPPLKTNSENRAKKRLGTAQLEKELREWLETTVKDAEVEQCALTSGGLILQGGLSGGLADFTLVHPQLIEPQEAE